MTQPRSTASAPDGWLDVPAALISETGVVRLREAAGSDVTGLLQRLRSGDYAKPFVIDDGRVRRLHFGLDFVQSEMSIDAPYALNFAYTRKMMACLLFVPRPRHVVIVGLGGGSLTKFCYQQLPRARITTIEIDADVIAFGKLFDLPAEDARMRIVHADAVDYFATTDERADVVLVDGCDKHGISGAFQQERFYHDLQARLRPNGLLVMNLIGGAETMQMHLRQVARAFSGRLILHTIRKGNNRLLFAFKNPNFEPDWPALEATAKQLAQQHGLDYPAFCRKLRSSQHYQNLA